jgi:predicted KAP-like P-loop ATPase
MRTQIRKSEWSAAEGILPLILGKELEADLNEQEINKLELFEKGLKNEIKKNDSIAGAITKMVKLALAAEFGPSLTKAQGASPMIDSIANAIMSDPQLKKQALIIIDRLDHE